MAELEYSNRIITTARPLPLEIQEKLEEDRKAGKTTIESTHLLTVDDEIIKDFFYVDCNWMWSGATETSTEITHYHEYDEVMAFVGSNQDDPHDIGGEITIWLDGQEEVLTRSCLIYVPAGVKHCPIYFKQIDKPIFWAIIAPSKRYSRKDVEYDAADYDKSTPPRYTIITKTKERFTVAASGGEAPPPPPPSTMKSDRILHMEDDMAKGAFYVDFVWLWEGTGQAPAPEHTHEWEELIAMVGADPENPRNLGGRMSIVLGDETHYIEKSSLVCIPKGLKHCPWKFLNIEKPTLVFTAGPSATYTGSHKKD